MPRLTLIAADSLPPATAVMWDPMICFVAAGSKSVTVGERRWLVGRGEMFFSAFDLFVTAALQHAPYRSAVLHLDVRTIAELLLELDGATTLEPAAEVAAQMVAPMPDPLLQAVTRWVRLLDTPGDIPPLAAHAEAEMVYRLLRSPLEPSLRQFAAADSAHARIRAAVGWLRAHYNEPVRIEHLAAIAHVSPATLHRQFKAATGMSPIRFQKQARLQEARRLLVAGTTAAEVAHTVGYSSPTQFNREYRRAYGLPPAQDAAHFRQRLA
ncbi:MAG TPA: AraC family transcriptional regulator [Pseudonocardiaceae bacterium]